MSIRTDLRALGGVAPLSALRATGSGARAVQRAVEAGHIRRVRRGWYASPDADSVAVLAAAAGGVPTCVTATAVRGLWEPPGASGLVHVAVPHGAKPGRLTRPAAKDPGSKHDQPGSAPLSVRLHWHLEQRIVRRGRQNLVDVLSDVLRCQQADVAFAIIESALRRGVLSPQGQAELASRVSSASARIVLAAGDSADSGSESLFRFRLLRKVDRIIPQAEIVGVGRVDFLIGDRLIVEIDSDEHHAGRQARRHDLQRDSIATGLGFLCLRFDFWQVLDDWATVESTVMAIIDRGDHLQPVRH